MWGFVQSVGFNPSIDPIGSHPPVSPSLQLADDELQSYFLHGVSRTFALTIPQLPPALHRAVANAYLLCRIVDTVEDEVALTRTEKNYFCERFAQVVAGTASASEFSNALGSRLSDRTLPAEHELIVATPRVIAITHGFTSDQRVALERCVRIMARGMAEYQSRDLRVGLHDLEDLSLYCYYVAGVVGEMLTELFCCYSPEIARHREALMPLSVSFGQGLQMTNILKDVCDDHSRDVVWLPRGVFDAVGYDLDKLGAPATDPAFGNGIAQLVAVAHGHLRNALDYTLLIPAKETGIRDFCLWALGMAILTLRKIHYYRKFIGTKRVKISRNAVGATIFAARTLHRSDTGLRLMLAAAGIGLPLSRQAPVSAAVQALSR